MDTLTRDGLKRLSQSSGGHHLSVYLTTHLAAPENQQDGIRFKNLLRQAEKALLDKGERSTEVREFMHPAWELSEDGLFWRPRPGGLAVFLNREGLRSYRLPTDFDEEVVVNSRFYVKPLINAVDSGERFYLLALSRDSVRLYRGTRTTLEELPLPEGAPRNMQEALRNDEHRDDTRQWHTQTGGAAGRGGGERRAMFFGSGVDAKEDTRELSYYFHRVAHPVFDVVKFDTAPMVVAAVDYEVPVYREANEYPNLLDEAVLGNPQGWSEDELHRKAWEIVRPLFENARRQALERFNELEGTGHASTDPSEVVRAAAYGRVDSLFVNENGHLWGTFDVDTGEVAIADEATPHTEDLTDLAVTQTVLTGGSVFAGGVRDKPLGAIFRY